MLRCGAPGEEVRRSLRRITISLITAAGLLVLVSTTTFFVSEHPTALAQKQPTRTVSIQNFSFKPANITIKRGTRVIWINKEGTQHTATANNGRSFDSGTLGPGQRFSHTFKRAGKKAYHCEIHPSMKGSVTVKR
jgi:plastocyanin